MYHDNCSALDQGKAISAVFCDVLKALDRVWHEGLIHKLSSLCIHGPLLYWFAPYLLWREQRVVFANTSSSWCSILVGVPEGSILGSLLFLIYMNELVNSIQTKIRLFADYTPLYILADSPKSAAEQLTEILRKLNPGPKHGLFYLTPLKLNLEKTLKTFTS